MDQAKGRRLCWVAAGAAPALWLGAQLLIHGILLPAAVAAAGAFLALLAPLAGGRRAIWLWLAGCGAGLALFGLYQTRVVEPQWRQAGWSGMLRCQTTGYAQGMGEYGQVECRALALGEEETSFSFRLYLTDASPDLGPGQTLQVEARLDRAPLDSLRGFSKQGQFLTARQIGGLEVETGSPAWWSWAPRTARHMQECFARWLPQRQAALLTGITTGQKDAFTAQQRRDLNLSGTSHLTAVSGLHVSVLLSLCVLALGKRGGLALGVPLCLGFAWLSGFTPSAVRAVVMACLPAGAMALRRESDSLTGLAAALLVLLLWNPMSVLDVGLQLSFGATLGLILFLPPLQQAIGRRFAGGGWRRLCRGVLHSLAASGAALCFTLPLSALVFSRVSLVSLLTNLLIVPLLPPILALGLALPLVEWCRPLAVAVSGALRLLLGWVDGAQHASAQLPFASARGGAAFLLVFGLLAAGWALFALRRRSVGAGLGGMALLASLCLILGAVESSVMQTIHLVNCGGSALLLAEQGGRVQALCVGSWQGDAFYQTAQNALDRLGGDRVERLWLTTPQGIAPIDETDHWAQVDTVAAPAGSVPGQMVGRRAMEYRAGGAFSFAGGQGVLLPGGESYGAQLGFSRGRVLLGCGLEPAQLLAIVQQTGARADILVVDAAYGEDLPRLAAVCQRVEPQLLVCIQPDYAEEETSLGAAFQGPIAYLQPFDSLDWTMPRQWGQKGEAKG